MMAEKTKGYSLHEMLTWRRPHGTQNEGRFIRRFLLPLGCEFDDCGNVIKRIGESNVLWSSHTDTVHRRGGKQSVILDEHGFYVLNKHSDSNCLGADCTVGIWLMAEMIMGNVPGLYVFHRGEESGGIGSTYIAKETPELLDGIEAAIALDRMGTASVITHQFGRCCSDAFGDSLAKALAESSDGEVSLRLDSSGLFTDTANYDQIVPECTNLSVGYYDQHTKNESQDVLFAHHMRDALLKLDTSNLVIERDPDACWSYAPFPGDRDNMGRQNGAYHPGMGSYPDSFNLDAPSDHALDIMAEMISDNPTHVAAILQQLGYGPVDIAEAIDARGGYLNFGSLESSGYGGSY